MTDKLKAVVDLLRTDAMDRILGRARGRAEEELPEAEASAANPRLVYRDHYAAQAEQCREEIAVISAVTAALAAFDAEPEVVWVPVGDGSGEYAKVDMRGMLFTLTARVSDCGKRYRWRAPGYRRGYQYHNAGSADTLDDAKDAALRAARGES